MSEVLKGLRYIVNTGAPWRWMAHDHAPWGPVYQQAQRWLTAECLEQLAENLRVLLRLASGRDPEPSAAILDSRTMRSTPERSERARHDGAKHKKGSKVFLAVAILGNLLALRVTPADADDRDQVGHLAETMQAATGHDVESAYDYKGSTSDKLAKAALAHGIELEVVKLLGTKCGFILLPRRWVDV